MTAAVERRGDMEQFQLMWAENAWQDHFEAPLQIISTVMALAAAKVIERLNCCALYGR